MSVEFPCAYYTEGRCTRYPVRNNEVSYCGGNEGCSGRVPSNSDRIRAMTDEELAEFMRSVCDTWYIDANQNWLSWLKSPAESSVFESMKRGLEQAINGETRSVTLTRDGDGDV